MGIIKRLKDIDKKHPLKHVNNFIDNLITIVGITCMLLGVYCLLDNYNVYNQANAIHNLGYKPTVTEDGISFDDVPNAVAWLEIPNTSISYPVMQGKDNLEYLNKNCFNKYSLSGSIFLDFKNNKNFSDNYNLIYGHHMSGGSMFGELDNFLDSSFFEKHKVGYLLTKDKVYRIDFTKCIVTDARDESVFSLDFNREISKEHREIALTTCKTSTDTSRIALLGTLEEISAEEYKKIK